MTFEIIVRLHTTERSKSRETHMSDRSKQLAQEFKAKQEAEELARKEESEALQTRNAKAVLDAKTLAREAPKVWSKFCAEFKRQCEELNAESGMGNVLLFAPQNSSQIIVSRVGEGKPSLRISFGANDYRIRIGGLFGPAKGGELRVRVLDGDSEPSLTLEDGRPVDVEATVEDYIRFLLELR